MAELKRIFRKIASLSHMYTMRDGWRSYTWEEKVESRRLNVERLKVEERKLLLAGFNEKSDWHDRFCADPFLFRHKGETYLFYETLNKARKGILGCFKQVDGKWVQQGKVMEKPWHLSYPQVFEEDGHIYMIPEESDFGKGKVRLYEAVDFPFKWEERAVLIDRPFADSTILKHERHWYMACYTIPPKEGAEVWHAPSLMGPWERHPCWDKINQSKRLRRCGGSFVKRGDKLYRIAQDCNGFYGKRLFKVPVEEITPTTYREGKAELLADKTMPPYGYTHTYNELDSLRVVDVHWDEFKPLGRMIKDIIKVLRHR